MKVNTIVEKLSLMYESDLETLFKAILKAELPSSGYTLGEAKALNNFKESIKRNSVEEQPNKLNEL